MNQVTETILRHRSIRHFQNRALPSDVKATLLDCAIRAPTTAMGHFYSIVEVEDPVLRQSLYERKGGSAMLGYCGINCYNCNAYRGTVDCDMALLEKVAGTCWSGAYSAKDWVCLGCRPADQPFLARYCAQCKIRACAIARGVPNCAACAGFEECRQLQEFLQGEGEVLVQKMRLLRERFLAGNGE